MTSNVVPLRKPKPMSTAAKLAMGMTMIVMGRKYGNRKVAEIGKRLLAEGRAEQAARIAAELAKKRFPLNDG